MPCNRSRCTACFAKSQPQQQPPRGSRAASVDARLVHACGGSPVNARTGSTALDHNHQQHGKPWRLGSSHYDHTSPARDAAAAAGHHHPPASASRSRIPLVQVRANNSVMPSCRSPNKYLQHVADVNREIALRRQEEEINATVQYHRHYPASLQNLHDHTLQQQQYRRGGAAKFVDPLVPTPMPLFHDPMSPKRKYDSSLTLGPVSVQTKSFLRRSMEKLPVQVAGPDGVVPPEHMWDNPDVPNASSLSSREAALVRASQGIGNVRWWRTQVPFSMPYDPAVQDYDPTWVNSAVQRVISDRGVTVHKLSSYAPQHWDSCAAPHLGDATTAPFTGVARSWSIEERAARSVGSVRAPSGISLRCNHFLGESASVHPTASLAGKCLTGATASVLLSLARPKTISRGSERGATGLSLAKFAFAHEQAMQATYPGIGAANIGDR